MFTISKQFGFSASHELKHLPTDHQCRRNHGHNYLVTLTLATQKLTAGQSWVRDYGDLAPFKALLDATLDHRFLNDALGTPMPTAEAIAYWLFEWAIQRWPEVVSVGVSETPATTAVYSRAP
jgi:6-pyruvoyltetrahydropterin/6-carboxytetrahydropterin synthase